MSATLQPVQNTCVRCLMDTSDPTVVIGDDGECNYCREFDTVWLPRWKPDARGERELDAKLDALRQRTKRDRYQMVLGLSGGIDSSFLAARAKEWELRVLAVHVDAGWDTPESLFNVEALIDYCGFDYKVLRPDWETMRQLQLAFLRSGLKNQDIPQDHAFFTGLYGAAHEFKVRDVLSGSNIATEAISSRGWGEPAMDSWLIKDVARHGNVTDIKKYPMTGLFEYYVVNPYIRKMTVFTPLNLMQYRREDALAELTMKVGFKDYGSKHSESYFTRYLQGYYMPKRFGIDKRRAHLSNQINSGLISREDGLKELEIPLYTPEELESDRAILCEKLRITPDELESFALMPPQPVRHYRSQSEFRAKMKKIQTGVERLAGRRFGRYY